MSEAIDRVDKQLQEHLRVLYRQVVDADQYLDDLREQGKAKFDSIFIEQTAFETKGNRFQPYLQEVTKNVEAWQLERDNEALLKTIVEQLQLLTETLARLKQIRQAG
tara:strand:- start:687 stop:1007 length:321 start_codon:yes stop_codon:yes gene_type:complete